MRKIFCVLLMLISNQFLVAEPHNGRDPSLIRLWHFNEGTGVNTREQIAGDSLALNGAQAWVSGKFGYGVENTGDGYMVSTIADGGGIAELDEFTIFVWILYKDVDTADRDLILTNYNPSDDRTIEFANWTDTGAHDPPVFNVTIKNTNGNSYTKLCPYVDGTLNQLNVWYMLTITYKRNDKWELFVNAVSTNSMVVADFPTRANTGKLYVLHHYFTIHNYTIGIVDEVAIYDRAFTHGEIVYRYRKQKGKYVN